MKRLFYIIAVAASLAFTAVSCKPSEKHYREAYEVAAAKKHSADSVEATIYDQYRRQARKSAVTLGGDTLNVQTEYVGYTTDGGASREITQRYNVVVGRFKQQFNAREMRKRLISLGYENPFILHTREPLYYVVSATCSTAQEALEQMRRAQADTSLRLREPLPFILQPAHMAR